MMAESDFLALDDSCDGGRGESGWRVGWGW